MTAVEGRAARARRAIEIALAMLDAKADGVDDAALYDALVVLCIREFVRDARGRLPLPVLERGRLFDDSGVAMGIAKRAEASIRTALGREAPTAPLDAGDIGRVYESLIAFQIDTGPGGRRQLGRARGRKRTGSFYTPDALARVVAERSVAAVSSAQGRELLGIQICDPAMGAGAFLIAAAEALLGRLSALDGERRTWRRRIVETSLNGVDCSATAVAVAEACLWLYAADPELPIESLRDRLLVGDCLDDGETSAFQRLRGRVDWLIGNPPWVAFAGRAAQPLEPQRRADYARRFRSWRGYPTLHGMFIERAAQIAEHGVVALLVPSPIADLDGYRAARRALTSTHAVAEPLLEFGQDAFEGVTQPCFALIALPSAAAEDSDRRWNLAERQKSTGAARAVEVPEVLVALTRSEPLPRECFREFGFQTSRLATTSLLLRASGPDAEHAYPLLEGRDVRPFRVGPPRLFIDSDPARIKWAGCRLRPEGDYASVPVVIRQTAKAPIAALHTGLPFRNSLLAGFEADGIDAELLVGLLNSALYRALHLSQQRDARQAAFPQVKIAHLRGLPRPPIDASARERVRVSCRAASAEAQAACAALDTAVFDLFAIPEGARREVIAFVAARAPELGHVSA